MEKSFKSQCFTQIDYMETLSIPKSSSAWVLTAYGVSEFGGRLLCALFAGRLPFSLAYVYAGSSAFVGVASLLAPQGQSLGVMYAYGIGKSKISKQVYNFFDNPKKHSADQVQLHQTFAKVSDMHVQNTI